MSFLRSAITIAFIALLLAAAASAQQKNELAGTIGRTFISDQTVTGVTSFDTKLRSGNGLTFEVDYGRRLLGGDNSPLSLTFEIPVAINPDEDIHFSVNLVPASYSSFFVTPSARINLFAASRVSPWVSLGGGFGHFSAPSTLEFGGNNPGPSSSTPGVFQIGGGFDVRMFQSLGFRAEVRDFNSGHPPVNVTTTRDRQHNLLVSGGVVLSF
jgi:hypothetical protein